MLQSEKKLAKCSLRGARSGRSSRRELHGVVSRGEGEHAQGNVGVGGDPSLAQLLAGGVVNVEVLEEVGDDKEGDDLDDLVAHA